MKPAISFAMLCFLVPLCFGSGADTNRTWQPWRIAQNQGINVLFCYLRVHNVPCEYSDLMKEQVHEVGTGPYSANTLVHLAAKRGVSLRVASLTMKEFESCERPVITYMTSDTPDDGAFLLVMNSTDAEVFYIAGAVASIHSMSLEDFRRVWSGIALLESKGWAVDWILFGLALSAAWTVTIGIRWCMAQKKGLRYAHIYRTCAPVTLFCLVAVWAGEAATLPVEVREQLEKQRAALRTVYFEFEQTTLRNDREVTYTNTAYFEGDRFRVKAPSDVSFDGELMWLVSTHPRNVRPPFILRKTKIRNTTETTPSFNELYWRLPYFEAAGIYFPPYPKDVRTFEALEPMVLRFVENSESIEIMPEGAHLRLRFYVDDWVLLNSREIDPVMFRKQIEGMPISPERKSYEVSILQKTRTMVPKRTVSMLLDSNHSYVPLEREDRSADGQLIARYGVQEWKYFADVAIWLPAKCVV